MNYYFTFFWFLLLHHYKQILLYVNNFSCENYYVFPIIIFFSLLINGGRGHQTSTGPEPHFGLIGPCRSGNRNDDILISNRKHAENKISMKVSRFYNSFCSTSTKINLHICFFFVPSNLLSEN